MIPLNIFIDIVSIIFIPVILAIFSYVNPRVVFTRRLTAIAYWLELAVAADIFWPVSKSGQIEQLVINENFRVDRLAVCFILLTTLVFATALTHANYLFGREENEEHGSLKRVRLRTFYFCVNLFFLSLCAVFISNNLGCLWMSIEATTLSSAPLVYLSALKCSGGYLEIFDYLQCGYCFSVIGYCLFVRCQPTWTFKSRHANY